MTPSPVIGPVIGLVNNMPDAALRSAERQFRTLLAAAMPGARLRLLTLPGIPRGELARAHIARHYRVLGPAGPDGPNGPAGLDALDGLIVTGTQPQSTDLRDEAIWPALSALADGTAASGLPVIWSCLAAHAAVLHLDGIPRQRLPNKLLGVFACDAVAPHPITAAMPSRWRTPHSRYNGLDPGALVAAGYTILSHSDAAGVDAFVHAGRPGWLFLQGHPEYAADTILLEHRRDLRLGHAAPPPADAGSYDWHAAAATLLAGWTRQIPQRQHRRWM